MVTNNNAERLNRESTDTRGQREIEGFFDALFMSPPTFTFFITVGTPTVDISLMGPMDLPLFVTRYAATSVPEGDAGSATSQFFTYIQELIESIRKKEKLRKDLYRNKPYVFCRGMPGGECTVCLGEFRPKQHIRRLECDHEFHKKCIDKWLLQGNSCCPLCRKEPFGKKAR